MNNGIDVTTTIFAWVGFGLALIALTTEVVNLVPTDQN